MIDLEINNYNNTYDLIFQEIKTIKQWNLMNQNNIRWEIFSLKYHAQNVVQKLVLDFFLKKSKFGISLDQNSLQFYTVCFCCMPNSSTTKLYWKWGPNHLLLPHKKISERGVKLVSLPHLLHDFQKNVS